jgi:hypothetical protein
MLNELLHVRELADLARSYPLMTQAFATFAMLSLMAARRPV